MLDAFLRLNLPAEVVTILISAVPVIELRGAVPVAIQTFQFPWYYAFILAVIGNMLPVPFLLLLWSGLSRLLERVSFFRQPIHWLHERTVRRSQGIERYGFIGLLIFVAVPLPLTGAWTASLVAVLLGMRFWPSFFSILGGVIIAGIIVVGLSLLGWWGVAIAVAAVAMMALLSLRRSRVQANGRRPS